MGSQPTEDCLGGGAAAPIIVAKKVVARRREKTRRTRGTGRIGRGRHRRCCPVLILYRLPLHPVVGGVGEGRWRLAAAGVGGVLVTAIFGVGHSLFGVISLNEGKIRRGLPLRSVP